MLDRVHFRLHPSHTDLKLSGHPYSPEAKCSSSALIRSYQRYRTITELIILTGPSKRMTFLIIEPPAPFQANQTY